MSDEKHYTLWALIRRLGPFLRPYLMKYTAAIALLTFTALLSLGPPYVLKVLVDDGIQAGRVSILDAMALVLVGITILSGITRWMMEYIHEWVSASFIADLRGYLFEHILRQPMNFFASTRTGDILGRLRNDITAVYGVLVNTFLGSLSEVVQIIGIIVLLFTMNATLALIAVSFIPPLYLFLIYSGRRLRRLSLEVRSKDVNLLEFFHERLNNVQLLKLYNREAYEKSNHTKLSGELINSTLKNVRYRFVSIFSISLLTASASILIMWYGGHWVIEGSLSFGSLFAFYLYTTRLYGPIQSLANRGVEIYNGLASAERLVEYLDLQSDIVEIDSPQRPAVIKGNIEFRQVSFSYPRSNGSLIEDLSLSIRAGQKVALVGQSGAGKTTLINLLGRLYDVDAGSIRIDGFDIRGLAFDTLYGSIGVIPQEAFLFNATIEENIRYGRVDATLEEVIDAAKKAHLHDLIEQMPNGYQTIIGPRGAKLSGGQRQRLAIARMIVKDAPIWILDEFTSSLDSGSESVVYENIMPLLKEKTALIIAHRLSTILSADLVVVMHNGTIMEVGSHSDLYRKDGLYKRLFDNQLWNNEDASSNGVSNGFGKSVLVSTGTGSN